MKEKMKHMLFVVAGLVIIVTGISVLFYNISYNPNFSVMDAISGATKNQRMTAKIKEMRKFLTGIIQKMILHYPKKNM